MTRPAAPQARVCPVCSTPLPDDAQFCYRCGTSTPTDPGVPPRTAATGVHEIAQVSTALADTYRIERVLGEGGMATVYLAQDLKHHRPVAVKVMRQELAATLGADRFLREIEIAAQLNHPHILALIDSGAVELRTGPLLYYVMPYVDGETVRELLDRETQLPVADAVRLASQVAEGLEYAHARGIIHRDIKPANILVSGRHALVADFGIARALGEGAALTQTGLSVGTPHYMAPEQASGEREVDRRADIYAIGAMLYEMLTGEPPFTGPNARAIITRSITERPRPLSESREGIPPALEALVLKALAKGPADRQQTAAELVTELERAMDAARTSASPAPAAVAPASPPLAWGLFAIGSLTGLALAYAAVRRWAMPGWVIGLAVLLVLIGAAVMFTTGLMEARRRRGIPTPGLARRFTWRNAANGGFLALGLWALVAAGLVLRGPGGSGEGGAVRLAVMPFENLGAADDAYFADGVADEVRGKLAQLRGFEVIARGSTQQYRQTTKSPTAIGAELGADYLLTATVRRAREGDGPGRVLVTPELMDVSTGTVRWQERFDRPDGDVLEVQSAIATSVAAALDVALSGSEVQEVENRPTENLAAYDLYLKGRAADDGGLLPTESVDYYEQAVAVDAEFSEAWAELVIALSRVYGNGARDPAVAERARRALARLEQADPGGLQFHKAAEAYNVRVVRDLERAALHADSALRLAPNDPDVIVGAARTDRRFGRTGAAVEKLQRARTLDPRSTLLASELLDALLYAGRFAEAREAAEVRAALGGMIPLDWAYYAFAHLADGDLAGAKAVVRRALREIPPSTMAAQLAGRSEVGWLLEEREQQILLRLTPAAFEDDRAWWAQSLATAHWQRGDRAAAKAYADSGLAISRDQAEQAPREAELRVLYALLLAYAGKREEALSEGRRALELDRALPGVRQQPYTELQLARIHMALDEPDEAMSYLEQVVDRAWMTGHYLRFEPAFRSLHGNPRFERIVGGD